MALFTKAMCSVLTHYRCSNHFSKAMISLRVPNHKKDFLNFALRMFSSGRIHQTSALSRSHSCLLLTKMYPTRSFLYKGLDGSCIVRLLHSSPMSAAKFSSQGAKRQPKQTTNIVLYVMATIVAMLGATFAGVPLYKVFCQATGLGGMAQKTDAIEIIKNMKKVEREIKVIFKADVSSSMQWSFKPTQPDVTVAPGETALAFYTATNPTDKAIIGISTYNIIPYAASPYFNKIQCFCFEEQRLNPKEQVDMPVFFYIDPEFDEDPKLENVKQIILSYTFFEAKDGLVLPYPGYPQPHNALPAAS